MSDRFERFREKRSAADEDLTDWMAGRGQTVFIVVSLGALGWFVFRLFS